MEKKIFSLIRMLSIPNEIVIDLDLSVGFFETIEIIEEDIIVLHQFDDDMDLIFPFNELSESDQKKVYDILKVLLYN